MTHDVTQWLAEIKALKQQLAEVAQERDKAYASSANWRKLYETEAQQRRVEASTAQELITLLKAEIQHLQNSLKAVEGVSGDQPMQLNPQPDMTKLHDSDELREQLIELVAERNRLVQSLQTEQMNHAQTRRSLITALGDTVDLLAQERAKQRGSTVESGH